MAKMWSHSARAVRRIQDPGFHPLNPQIWSGLFETLLPGRTTQASTGQGDNSQQTNHSQSRGLGALFYTASRWFTHRFSPQAGRTPDFDLENNNLQQTGHAEDQQDSLPFSRTSSDEEAEPQFVKDALQWLIFNSRNADSIDTAIEALAISKVAVDDESLMSRINSHLVKHFCDCFSSDENGTKLQILQHQHALKNALDYVEWMSFFAGGNHKSIFTQAADFITTLGAETVTNLGLALASLVEQRYSIPSKASENVMITY
ncbi:hypothetical protein FRC07_004242 [Ceratobasidium sp. 392]|nr:hypothetical protein FRC07_004242 [Ceratobasidium sp. 392]